MTGSITQSAKMESKIPNWIIWVQCTAFVVLYAFWILPEIVGFRNTALVVGALFGAYSIYQYRDSFLQKAAIPIWLIIALFIWATLHLFFLSSNFSLQYIEYFRIWKYAALGGIMATGLGISLFHSGPKRFLYVIYFGLCTPLIIYLVKYMLTSYGVLLGVELPISLLIYDPSVEIDVANRFYIPKTDYVAFCLPALAMALGFLIQLSQIQKGWNLKDFFSLLVQILVIGGTLFLFSIQNIKNGMAYAAMLFIIFGIFFFSSHFRSLSWKKIAGIILAFLILISAIAFNVKKNDSWRTLIAEKKIGIQLEKYSHWKDTIKYGYPQNEYGTTVSITNYERAAWATAGIKLSIDDPIGYGLIEDSFAKMAKEHWPDVGATLSHSHSGWLDLILAIGYPGFLLIFSALLIVLKHARLIIQPWAILAFWPLLANLLLWCTTEVSATVTFATLIFWICLGAGLSLTQTKSSHLQTPAAPTL